MVDAFTGYLKAGFLDVLNTFANGLVYAVQFGFSKGIKESQASLQKMSEGISGAAGRAGYAIAHGDFSAAAKALTEAIAGKAGQIGAQVGAEATKQRKPLARSSLRAKVRSILRMADCKAHQWRLGKQRGRKCGLRIPS